MFRAMRWLFCKLSVKTNDDHYMNCDVLAPVINTSNRMNDQITQKIFSTDKVPHIIETAAVNSLRSIDVRFNNTIMSVFNTFDYKI